MNLYLQSPLFEIMKATTTMFTSLFVLVASLKAVSGQFAGIPPCGSAAIDFVAQRNNCASGDTPCVCAKQSDIMNRIFATCPVEDRAGSGYFVREGCSNASSPPAAPAPSASASSSASASDSATSSSAETPATDSASSTGTPATPGTPTSTGNTPAAPAAATTAPPTRSLASGAGADDDDDSSSSSRMVRSSSSPSRASTVVVVKTLGAGDDETGLGGGAGTVKAGAMGYVVSVAAIAVGALLL